MKIKWNKIDIWYDSPSVENVKSYLTKSLALYNKGDYEAALEGFEKLSELAAANLRNILVPHIEKCRNVLDKKMTSSDKRHLKNQAVLKYFGWLDEIKYMTGFISFLLLGFGMGDLEKGGSFFKHPWFIGLAAILAVLTTSLHVLMRRFIVSENLIRCKYCGKFTDHINPNKPTLGFLRNNCCNKCGRMYSNPDFFWDGWEGLEYMERRRSVPDENFYKEYSELKRKYSKEYSIFVNKEKHINN